MLLPFEVTNLYSVKLTLWVRDMILLEYVIFKCPVCKAQLSNPNKLREHNLRQHRKHIQLKKIVSFIPSFFACIFNVSSPFILSFNHDARASAGVLPSNVSL
jgi:hypothetical protein